MTPPQETNPCRITGPHARRVTLLATFQTAVAAHTQHLDDVELDQVLAAAMEVIRPQAPPLPEEGAA